MAQLRRSKNQEGNLDVETMIGIAYPIPMIAYNTGGMPPFKPDALTTSNSNEPYQDWLNFMKTQTDLPTVVSSSYGDDEQTVPKDYATAVCQDFAQLGARGVSILFSSGDNGVGSTGNCIANDGSNKATFLPAFPAGCPYVTTVGATKNFAPEVAAFDPLNGFTSGGGFSNYFSMPAYQQQAVTAYTSGIGGQFAGMFNATGRGYPDIAAQGQAYVTIYNGRATLVDGTSASAPAFAAVMALVNDAMIASGRPPMGFLNPWLYQRGFQAMNDVVSGSAKGCGGEGFLAKAGWDPVTGFGTPVSTQSTVCAALVCRC